MDRHACFLNHPYHHHHPEHEGQDPNTSVVDQAFFFPVLLQRLAIMSMVGLDGGAAQRVGAGKRRRGRQLRAFHWHEVLSVKMALATASTAVHSRWWEARERRGVHDEQRATDAPLCP